MKKAEITLKENLISDALSVNEDIFGRSLHSQFMKDMLITGAIIWGGHQVGLSFAPHAFHVPFLRHGRKDPTLTVNPFVGAGYKAWEERSRKIKMDEDLDPFLISAFNQYFKATGYLPQTLNKALRINRNDIPEFYQGSWMQYLFSVPPRGHG